jgi:hypothetical protein
MRSQIAQARTSRRRGFEFNPGFVGVAPPALWRRIVGATLLVLGGLLLFIEVPLAIMSFDVRDRDMGMKLVGMFLVPALAIFGGIGLAGGTIVHEERPQSKENAPPAEQQTWEEE